MGILDSSFHREALDIPPRHADSDIDSLLGASVFRAIQREEVVQILGSFGEDRFEAGHRLTLQGLRGSDFFLIVRGRALVCVDGDVVAKLGPGDFFGEVGVMSDGLRTATVIAETPLHCFVLPHRGLERLLIEHPRLSVNLLREVLNRFREVSSAHAGDAK